MEAPRKKSAKVVQPSPSSSSSCYITNIPYPILMEILCRLTIKTLMGSKSVCKSWLHLIRDPHFSQLHQARAPTEICFRFFKAFPEKLHLGNFSFLKNLHPLDIKLNTLLDFPRLTVRNNNNANYNAVGSNLFFANSCNGLLCYYGRIIKHAVVWNPCTGEFITFPPPKTHKGLWICLGYGFGFSRKANKFKLLRMIRRKDTRMDVAEICTIEEACSWKTVGSRVSVTWFPQELTYVTLFQGTLHWVSLEIHGLNIQTFDFEDEQFGRQAFPSYLVKTRWTTNDLWEETLGVWAGCLVIMEYTNEGMNIWLMKEYGVQDSWTKLFSLGFYLGKGLVYKRCLPITYMDNGEVLMMCNINGISTAFFYNPILKSVIGSDPGTLRVITYRPCLILLKDSMLGYEVQVKPVEKSLRRQHGSKVLERDEEGA